MKFTRTFIPAGDVVSLIWSGDRLVDWAGGIKIFGLDGKPERPRLIWGYSFDAACSTYDGQFAVVYKRLGTKALLLRDGKVHRELNRSYYFADAYEYPICIWRTLEGQTLLAHCPEDYCRIEIEDAETGARLTKGPRKPGDFFHSRLMVNSTGTRLLSAGWFWHPLDGAVHYSVAEALRDPTHLDVLENCVPNLGEVTIAEAGSACWQTTDRLLLGGLPEEESPLVESTLQPGKLRLNARGIAIYDIQSRQYTGSIDLGEAPGTMMPVGEKHAVCFYRYPKLVSLETGEISMRWEDLDSGMQTSSIDRGNRPPPLALDAANCRFAVAGPDGINVVQIDVIK